MTPTIIFRKRTGTVAKEMDAMAVGQRRPSIVLDPSAQRVFAVRLRLNGLFQFPGGPERDLLARLDLDGLAGRRIPSHPGRPLPHLEDAETGQTDFVAPLQMAGGQRHQIAQHGLSLLLCDLVAVGQRGGEVLECDGRLDGRFGWGGFLRRLGEPSSLAA